MKIAAIAFSDRGQELAGRIDATIPGGMEVSRCQEGGLAAWTDEHFDACDALVFVGATGIAVRAIAPHVQAKTTDPAVVVIDEQGRFAISLLSGHIGGANQLAEWIAKTCGAVPVVTTATDAGGYFAVDTWAVKHGLEIVNPNRIKSISGALIAGRPVHLLSDFKVRGSLPLGLVLGAPDEPGDPCIEISWHATPTGKALLLVPKCVVAGIGCRKGMETSRVEDTYREALAACDCHPSAIAGTASIDLKAAEPGIIEFSRHHGLPYETFSAEELNELEGEFSASDFVHQSVGVNNVCERASVLATHGGKLVLHKYVSSGVTMALAVEPYIIDFEE